MSARPSVLLSWIAVNNDPFQRDRPGQLPPNHHETPTFGPTLTLLFDPDSEFNGKIGDVVLLYRQDPGPDGDRERKALAETTRQIKRMDRAIQVHEKAWEGRDPTDHRAIFDFLKATLPRMRETFPERELVVHISPGTPSMQTIWVLMGETGFIRPPFQLVKSYRPAERAGRPPVVRVNVDLETFYKAYMASRPAQISSEDQGVLWDPQKFRSSRMKQLFDEARRSARLNVPILILGERGTGKTTLASWIRQHSRFRVRERDQCWPAVACGQYSPETMRAELFGYVAGAFTGAIRDHNGLLAAAHGDTLFLDEVGDVSRDLQRLLIKALEEGRYFRLGDDKPRTSHFRLLTATNLTPDALKKKLDLDFLDRISLLKLRLPPLREIPDELPWLWDAVYLEAARRAEASPRSTGLSEEARKDVVSSLSRGPLRGNLRDLFRVAYRLLAALDDPEHPSGEPEAVAYGLEALNDEDSPGISGPRAIAHAFAALEPLDPVLDQAGQIRSRDLDRSLKAWLADELYRIGARRGCPPAELCDVAERTLRGWRSEGKQTDEDRSDPKKAG